MTLLLTLLAFFIDEKPAPSDPPASAAAGIAPYDELAEAKTAANPFDYEKKASADGQVVPSASRHLSPSLMVASPPSPRPAPFDVFSPAVRPPHEFPALFACQPVALVPCPSPRLYEEPPAVRHVSYLEESHDAGAACIDAPCAESCPTLGKKPVAFARPQHWQPHWAQAHAPRHPHDPAPHHPLQYKHMTVPHHPLHPAAICPVGMSHPVAAGGSPHLPGAKHVQHIVRATYDVTPQTAEALSPFLTNSSGVFGYQIEGGELTINAAAHTQAAIAQFLAVMAPVQQTVSHSKSCLSVSSTNATCCNGKCECKGECKCCGGTKPPADSDPSAAIQTKLKAFSLCVGLAPQCKTAPACQASNESPASIDWKPSQSKSIQVKIEATSNGVVMQTSTGTQLRAKAIRLDTTDINQLEVHQADAVFTLPQVSQPQQATQPVSEPIIAY